MSNAKKTGMAMIPMIVGIVALVILLAIGIAVLS